MNLRYVINELLHHRHRTLVNVLGIAIGVALFISINAVSTAYKKAINLPFKNVGADLVIQKPEKRAVDSVQAPVSTWGIRLPFSNQILPTSDLQRLRHLDGVAAMASSLLLWDFGRGGFTTIMGVDPSQPSLGPIEVKKWLISGRFPDKEGEVVLEKHYAKFHHIQLGGVMTIGNRRFTVVGLLEIKQGAQILSANIYLPLQEARRLLGNTNGVNIVYLRLQNPSFLTKVKSQIGTELPGVSVTSSDSFLELMGGVSEISDQFSWLASLIAFGGAVFLIIKTMLANLVARSSEIGILKAVGWTRRNVQEQLMAEVLLQSFAGGLVGLVAGYAISYCLGFLSIPVPTPWEINLTPAFAKDAATAATMASVRLPVGISAALTGGALALSLVAGALASFFMGRRISRMKPVDILRRL